MRTDRPDGDLAAKVVIACDGVNSFLAKEAGLYHHDAAEHYTLGAKEVLALPKEEIDRRFGLVDRQGFDLEMVGVTRGIPGGGFLYTNLESVAVGVVVNVVGLAEAKVRPEELIAGVKRHPSIAPLLRGADLKEYTAHLIPEGGYDAMPELVADGLLVAGDAGGFCLAAGLFLEGVNFAIGSGAAAGRDGAAAVIARGDTTVRAWPATAGAGAELRAGRPQEDAPGPRAWSSRAHAAALCRADVRRGRGLVHGDKSGAQAGPAPAVPPDRSATACAWANWPRTG